MEFCAKSDVGLKRAVNEDCFGSYLPEGKPAAFFVVADGMGGHNAGEVASKMAVDCFLEEIETFAAQPFTLEELQEFAVQTMRKANEQIFLTAAEDDAKRGMGTTAVFCAVYEKKIVIANVGDSRVYLISPSGNRQLTVDHSYVETLIQCGYIDRAAARIHPGRNLITRALGIEVEIEVDTFVYDYQERDVVILCTDGLNSMVTDKVIYNTVQQQTDVCCICDKLISLAKDNGGTDNITIIVARL